MFQGPGFESRWRCMFFTLVVFEIRFLVGDCLKYTQQCQNGISERTLSGHSGTLVSNMDLPSIS